MESAPVPSRSRRPFRVLTYSHDSYGLGHLRRSITLATAMVARGPQVHALCLTGSPVPETFPLPERCDLVKLPSIGKTAAGEYVARRLPLSVTEVTTLRSDLITATVRAFRPDLLLVDHTAAGPGGELLPVLRRLRHEHMQTRIVLGLRDVLDSPLRARAELGRSGTFEVVRAFYDHVLVYGDRELFDPIREYGIPDDIAAKTTFTGPVVPAEARHERAPTAGGSPARLLITAGGGEDGYELLRGAVAALRGPLRERQLRATIVAGPLLPTTSFEDLVRAAGGDARLQVLACTNGFQGLLAQSDLVVGRGGYNTVYETLACGVPLLCLPRRSPREEQWERCRRLAAHGHLTLLDERHLLDPHAMALAITGTLRAPRSPRGMRCDGAEVAADQCLSLRRAPSRTSDPMARLGG